MKQLETVKHSYHLFKLINKHRVECGKAPMKKHNELVRKIKDELGEERGYEKITLFYDGANDAKMSFEAIELSRRDVYLVAMRESKQVRAAIYDYLEECEAAMHTMFAILTQKGYLPQELGAQTAGIEHPRLFMKYIKKLHALSWFIDKGYLEHKRVGKAPDALAWRWTQLGYRYLLDKKDYFNNRVEELHTMDKKGLPLM